VPRLLWYLHSEWLKVQLITSSPLFQTESSALIWSLKGHVEGKFTPLFGIALLKNSSHRQPDHTSSLQNVWIQHTAYMCTTVLITLSLMEQAGGTPTPRSITAAPVLVIAGNREKPWKFGFSTWTQLKWRWVTFDETCTVARLNFLREPSSFQNASLTNYIHIYKGYQFDYDGANNWRSTAYIYVLHWCLNHAAKFSPIVCWTNHSTGFPSAGIRLTATNGTAHTKIQGQMLFVACFVGAGGLNFSSSSHKSGWFRNSSCNWRTKGEKGSHIVHKMCQRKERVTLIPLGRHRAGTVPFCQEYQIVTSTKCNRGPEKQGHEKHKIFRVPGQQAPVHLIAWGP
jgi:hypothetical protein